MRTGNLLGFMKVFAHGFLMLRPLLLFAPEKGKKLSQFHFHQTPDCFFVFLVFEFLNKFAASRDLGTSKDHRKMGKLD